MFIECGILIGRWVHKYNSQFNDSWDFGINLDLEHQDSFCMKVKFTFNFCIYISILHAMGLFLSIAIKNQMNEK